MSKKDWFYSSLSINEKINYKSWLQWTIPFVSVVIAAYAGCQAEELCAWESPMPESIKKSLKTEYSYWDDLK
jgi:hypothetical protein